MIITYSYHYFLILMVLINLIFPSYEFRIHEYMTKREVKLIFGSNHKQMLDFEYDLAPMIIRRKREQISIEFKVFDEKYITYLEESDNVLFGASTSMFIAKANYSEENDKMYIHYHQVPYILPGQKINFYNDKNKKSTVTIYTDAYNKLHINGELENGINIRSLPKSLVKRYAKFENFSSKFFNPPSAANNTSLSSFHIVWNNKMQTQPNTLPKIPAEKLKQAWKIHQQIEFDKIFSDTVYPEILVVVDYETFKTHGKDYETVATYMAAFWNSVDLRFRQMTNPKIRFNIAGIVIPEDIKAEPYFKRNSKHKQYYDGDNTLLSFGKYFNSEFRQRKLCNYDVAVGITNLSPIKFDHGDGVGLANFARICNDTHSAAIIQDKGFNGVNNAAHELGHLFGAAHDGHDPKTPPELKLSNPCSPTGNIMSTFTQANANYWSKCSLINMRIYIRKFGLCLINKPDVIVPHLKKLPGKFLTRNQQCAQISGPEYYSVENSSCEKLTCIYCSIPIFWCDVKPLINSPAEGSSCGENKFCLNSTCIDDPGWFNM